jgi:hypothetical protein
MFLVFMQTSMTQCARATHPFRPSNAQWVSHPSPSGEGALRRRVQLHLRTPEFQIQNKPPILRRSPVPHPTLFSCVPHLSDSTERAIYTSSPSVATTDSPTRHAARPFGLGASFGARSRVVRHVHHRIVIMPDHVHLASTEEVCHPDPKGRDLLFSRTQA